MKEYAHTGLRITVNRENLGVEKGMTATSTSLETGTQISAISERTTSLKRTQGTT
jgi:16S rRNA C1402 N4-methylase RsmH